MRTPLKFAFGVLAAGALALGARQLTAGEQAPAAAAAPTVEAAKSVAKTETPFHSIVKYVANQVSASDCGCPTTPEGRAKWAAWFDSKDAVMPGLKAALIADGWTKESFLGFFDAMAKQSCGDCAKGCTKADGAVSGSASDAKAGCSGCQDGCAKGCTKAEGAVSGSASDAKAGCSGCQDGCAKGCTKAEGAVSGSASDAKAGCSGGESGCAKGCTKAEGSAAPTGDASGSASDTAGGCSGGGCCKKKKAEQDVPATTNS